METKIEQKSELKLNYKRTFYMGFAFFAILMLWQMYNHYCPLFLRSLLQSRFGDQADELTYIIGIIMAADNLLAIFMLPLFGRLSDKTKSKYGRRMPYMVIGMILSALLFPLIAVMFIIDSIIGVIIMMAVILIVMNMYRNPAVALMPDVTPKPLRSQANGIINFVGYIGAIVGGLIAMILPIGTNENGVYEVVNKNNALIAFIIASVFMIIALVILVLRINEPNIVEEMKEQMELGENISRESQFEEDKKENTGNALSKFNKRNVIILLFSVFFWFVSFNAVETYNSIFCTEVLKAEWVATINIALLPISSIVTFILTINLSSKIGRKKAVLLGLIIILIGFTLIIIHSLFNYQPLFLFFIPILLCGIGWALINANSYPMIVEVASKENVGKYTGYYYTSSMIAQSVTPVLLGFLISFVWNFDMLYIYSFIAMLIATIIFSFYKEDRSHQNITKKKGFEVFEDND